jgi:hypothetical protein
VKSLKIVSFSLLTAFALSAPAFADTTLYSNGPTNGNNNGFYIDGPSGPFGQTISDSFVASASGNASILSFGEWVPTGDTPTSVSWSLGTSVFGDDISSGSTAQVGYTFLFNNGDGFDIYEATVTGLSGALTAGDTYFLSLNGANDSAGSQFDAWDDNEGPAQCNFENYVGSGGCPSEESEAFTLSTGSTSPTPEPGSLLLLGSGVLGMAGVVRRKLSR